MNGCTIPEYGLTCHILSVWQSLAVVTLGDKQMAQRVDNLIGVDEFKRFYLQVFLNLTTSIFCLIWSKVIHKLDIVVNSQKYMKNYMKKKIT